VPAIAIAIRFMLVPSPSSVRIPTTYADVVPRTP
jgi:hypothetical protein